MEKVAVYCTYGAHGGLYTPGRGEFTLLRLVPAKTLLSDLAKLVNKGKVHRIRARTWKWER